MKTYIVFVICAMLYIASPTEQKEYRDDYEYNTRTNAFYKIHVDSDLKRKPWRMEYKCQVEGAKLLSPEFDQDIMQVHGMMKSYPDIGNYVYVASDGKQHDTTDEQTPIIDLTDESDSSSETLCEVITRDGVVEAIKAYTNLPFVCKVEANQIPFNKQCGIRAKDYYYYPSVGSCYRIPEITYTWYEALVECQAEGAHLAVLNSDTERLVLLDMISVHGPSRRVKDDSYHSAYYHIGFRAEKTTGSSPRVFKTIFNQTLEEAGFSEWSPTEPNSLAENCGSVFENDGKLNDIMCAGRLYAFICEKEVKNV